MKTLFRFCSVLVLFVVMACGASKSSEYNKLAAQQIAEKNNQNIPLIDRIRRLSGMTIRNGIPYFMKAANQVSGTATEPLYILNGYTVGNSFYSVNQLVESANVKKIEALTGSDAAEYGSRGASGVIKITTYQ